MKGRQEHWDKMYNSKGAEQVTWYQPRLESSLALLEEAGLNSGSAVMDVGAGVATLVDDLLLKGVGQVTLLDTSAVALEQVRSRLGEAASRVSFIAGDITEVTLPGQAYDLWHDRAVFHFLTDPADRRLYLDNLDRALRQDGKVVLSSFAEDGPRKCSGLETAGYDGASLSKELGPGYRLVRTLREQHQTPWGGEQAFRYFLLERA